MSDEPRLPHHRCVVRHRRRDRPAARGRGLAARARCPLDREARGAGRGARRPRHGDRGRVRRDGVGRPAGRRDGRARALRPDRRRLGERRLRCQPELPRRHRRALARHGADERLRCRADDPGRAAGAEGVEGAPAADGLGRRSPRDSRLALLRDEARGSRDGRVGAAGARRHRRPGHRDRARHGRYARSSTQLPLEAPLVSDDIARAVLFALSQPPHVDVNEILVRPTAQPL